VVELGGAGECAVPRLQHVVKQRAGGILGAHRKAKGAKVLERAEIVGGGALRECRGTRGVQRDGTGQGQTIGDSLPKADAVVEHDVRRPWGGQRRNPVLC